MHLAAAAAAALVLAAVPAVLGQATNFPECTRELLRTDDCSVVVNPSACYNQFRWNARTLQCIDGANDAERKKRACKCCSCVGTVMCNWVTQNRYCN